MVRGEGWDDTSKRDHEKWWSRLRCVMSWNKWKMPRSTILELGWGKGACGRTPTRSQKTKNATNMSITLSEYRSEKHACGHEPTRSQKKNNEAHWIIWFWLSPGLAGRMLAAICQGVLNIFLQVFEMRITTFDKQDFVSTATMYLYPSPVGSAFLVSFHLLV